MRKTCETEDQASPRIVVDSAVKEGSGLNSVADERTFAPEQVLEVVNRVDSFKRRHSESSLFVVGGVNPEAGHDVILKVLANTWKVVFDFDAVEPELVFGADSRQE